LSYNPPTNAVGTTYYYVTVRNSISDNGDGGLKEVTVTAGPVAVTVSSTFNVANQIDWSNAINTIRTGGNGSTYTINITNSFSVPGSTDNTFGSVTGTTINIHNIQGDHTLSLTGTGNLLRIGSDQSVIIQNLNLVGHGSNNASLVHISGGTFDIRGNASVSGNTTDSNGGGVYVGNGGRFIMYDNTSVHGNKAISGGGVYSNGTFTMRNEACVFHNIAHDSNTSFGGGVFINQGTFTMYENSTIFGNTAMWGDGGVAVSANGTFRLASGIVYGINALSHVRNIAGHFQTTGAIGTPGYGWSLYNDRGIATYGGPNGTANDLGPPTHGVYAVEIDNTITQAGIQ